MNRKVWLTLDFSLAIVVLLLLLVFLGMKLPTLGTAQYLLDKEEPLCLVNWDGDYTPWGDLDRCCLESRKQLGCEKKETKLDSGRVDWVCHTGEGRVLRYWLNNKAYNYCRQQSIW